MSENARLLENIRLVKFASVSSDCALIKAIIDSDLEKIKELIDNGANINYAATENLELNYENLFGNGIQKGDTPLIIALKKTPPSIEIINLLLQNKKKYNLDLNKKNQNGESALIIAAKRSLTDIGLTLLVEGANPSDLKVSYAEDKLSTIIRYSTGGGEYSNLMLKFVNISGTGLEGPLQNILIQKLEKEFENISEPAKFLPFIVPNDSGELPSEIAWRLGLPIIAKYCEMQEKLCFPKYKHLFQNYLDFYDECRTTNTDVGGPLGLTQNITLTHPFSGNKVSIETRGIAITNAAQKIIIELTEYMNRGNLDKKTKDYFKKIIDATKTELDYLKDPNPNELKGMVYDINERDPKVFTNVSSGWTNHSISLCFFGNYLIVTDRSMTSILNEGKFDCGTKIYKLKDDFKMTDENLIKLWNRGNGQSKDQMKDLIFNMTDASYKPYKLPSSYQRHSTCTYANKKSRDEGVLFLQKVLDSNLLNTMDVCMSSKDPVEQKKAEEALEPDKKYAGETYKRRTYFSRELALEYLIAQYKNSSQTENVTKKEFYKGLLVRYLADHSGGPKEKSRSNKTNAELDRAMRILSLFDETERKTVLEAVKKIMKENIVDLELSLSKFSYKEGEKPVIEQIRKKIEKKIMYLKHSILENAEREGYEPLLNLLKKNIDLKLESEDTLIDDRDVSDQSIQRPSITTSKDYLRQLREAAAEAVTATKGELPNDHFLWMKKNDSLSRDENNVSSVTPTPENFNKRKKP